MYMRSDSNNKPYTLINLIVNLHTLARDQSILGEPDSLCHL